MRHRAGTYREAITDVHRRSVMAEKRYRLFAPPAPRHLRPPSDHLSRRGNARAHLLLAQRNRLHRQRPPRSRQEAGGLQQVVVRRSEWPLARRIGLVDMRVAKQSDSEGSSGG